MQQCYIKRSTPSSALEENIDSCQSRCREDFRTAAEINPLFPVDALRSERARERQHLCLSCEKLPAAALFS